MATASVAHAYDVAKQAGRVPFKVADLGLAEFGRKELRLAEGEMPGLMAIRKRYEGKQPLAVPVQDRLRRHHLRVEPRAAREQPMEEPAVPIRPVHHRGDAEFGGRVSHSLRISGVG